MHMCHSICDRWKIKRIATPNKHNDFQRIYEYAAYCKGCACYFDKKDAWKDLMCPCCHRKLRTRPKQKKNRVKYIGKTNCLGRPIRSLLPEDVP